jgi:hypothetical protein
MDVKPEEIIVRLLEINRKISGHPQDVTRTYLHKILYLLHCNKKLGLQASLPFYWYKYGPFSDTVDSAIRSAVDGGKIEEIRPSSDLEAYRLKMTPRKTVPGPIEGSLLSLLIKWNPYRTPDLIRHVYEECAPWPFYPAYKLDFLDRIGDLAGETGEDRISTLEPFTGPLPDGRLKPHLASLMRAEGALPKEPGMEHFNSLFLGFSGASARLMTAVLTGKLSVSEMRDVFRAGTDVWDTFTSGARTLPRGRDREYEKCSGAWNEDFQYRLSHLEDEVGHYIDHADEILTPLAEHAGYSSATTMAAVLAPYMK